jgi:hypothetical protein
LGAKEELKVENRGNGWTLNTFDPTSLEPTALKSLFLKISKLISSGRTS